jgi:hypothetical protein
MEETRGNEDWFEQLEIERQAGEDEIERRRAIADLQEAAMYSIADAIIPDEDDPLQWIDPTPESEADFPISLRKWNDTWHIEYLLEYSMDVYVTDDEEDEE